MSRPRVVDILTALEALAPPELAEGWDRIGFMVGRMAAEVESAAVALDATPEAVEAAHGHGAQVLVTHHPLLFKPLERLDLETPVGAAVGTAIRLGVNVLAAHTNLDSARGGVNDVLADLLELRDISPLTPDPGNESAGLGRWGVLDQELTLGRLADRVKDRLGVAGLRIVGHPERKLTKVALCGGSGGDFVAPARDLGAQVLITGEIAHHQAREAEYLGLAVIEATHFSTEAPVVKVLAGALSDKLAELGRKVEVIALESQVDPFIIY